MLDHSYCACVLWSRSAQKAHTLVTTDPSESLDQHNRGRYMTARDRPWELLHTREFGTDSAARTWQERLETADREGRRFELIGLDPEDFRP